MSETTMQLSDGRWVPADYGPYRAQGRMVVKGAMIRRVCMTRIGARFAAFRANRKAR